METITEENVRLDRERHFHNNRFSEEVRESQHKFYYAVEAIFERYRQSISHYAKDADVLEYGCSFGDVGRSLAGVARSVHGIDVSDVAVAEANRRVSEDRGAPAGRANCDFHVMDAQAMHFPDNSFDLVFGSGIIHHLDIERAFSEIRRVLRPGGRCVFIEPLGGNPVFDLYRKLTPAARTIDEMPLKPEHIAAFVESFPQPRLDYSGLASLASVPFRNTALGKPLRSTLEWFDRGLFAVPLFRKMAWFAILEGRKA